MYLRSWVVCECSEQKYSASQVCFPEIFVGIAFTSWALGRAK